VVELVNSGKWTVEAYHDYQRLAASTGNVDSARLLFEYSIRPDVYGGVVNPFAGTREDTSDEPTHEGLKINVAEVIQSMHKALLSCHLPKFKFAMSKLDSDVVKFLRLSVTASSAGSGSTTLLMGAAYMGCVDIVAFLLDEFGDDPEVDVDEVGTHGVTALMVAATASADTSIPTASQKDQAVCPHCEIIRMFVTKGAADINFKHKFAQTTALHMCSELSSYRTIPTLCQLGANTSAITSTGSTPLHTAASSGASAETIRALIVDCDIDINLLMNQDTTALYMASQHGHLRTVKVRLNFNSVFW
jgi:ankyrin repeat protein